MFQPPRHTLIQQLSSPMPWPWSLWGCESHLLQQSLYSARCYGELQRGSKSWVQILDSNPDRATGLLVQPGIISPLLNERNLGWARL